MITIDPKKIPTRELHGYLLGAIAPRPIAFASTIDREGRVNLSPFSYFNVFGTNPPILIFSPARRVSGNTQKHTLENVREQGEVVINIVSFSMVKQTSLASTEYDKGVNEFVKAGFTEQKSERVAPPRVAESPACFECKVQQVIETGQQGGAGNLVVCEVVLAHFKENIFNEDGQIDPHRLDAVGRMGGDWYCRAQGEALFTLPKPSRRQGMGIDQLPEEIRNSKVLTGSHLAQLASEATVPEQSELTRHQQDQAIKEVEQKHKNDQEGFIMEMHQLAKQYLDKGETMKAWASLMLI